MNYGSRYRDAQSRLGDASWVFVLKAEGSIGRSWPGDRSGGVWEKGPKSDNRLCGNLKA